MRSTIHAVNRVDDELTGTEKRPQELSIQNDSVRRKGRADAPKKVDDRRHHVEGDLKMSRHRSNSTNVPAALRPATLRAGLTLAVIAAMAAFAVRVQAEDVAMQGSVAASTPQVQLAAGLTFGFK